MTTPRKAKRTAPPLRSGKQLTDTQLRQLKEFSALLLRRMRSRRLSPVDVAQQTGLRQETIRSYLRAQNRPTKASLRRLIMIMGEDLAVPFGDTELAGAGERPIRLAYINSSTAMLDVHAPLPIEGALEVIAILRKHGVAEEEAPYEHDKS